MGFAPRHYFSSLVTARLLLYFSHSYYFFVAITRKEIHLHSKDENGIQPFPASGSPSAGFSLSLKCERRQQVAAYSSSELPPIKKDTQGVYIKGIQPFPASGNFINCSEGIRPATLFLFACYRSTPLILLSFLLFHCRYHSQKSTFI